MQSMALVMTTNGLLHYQVALAPSQCTC